MTQLGPYSQAILNDSPLRYYRLDDQLSTVVDIGSQGQNGTINGGVTRNYASLINDLDPSMLFDGGTGFLSLPTTGMFAGGTDFSIEAWLNAQTFTLEGGGVNRRAIMYNLDGNNTFQIVTDNTLDGLSFAVNDANVQFTYTKIGLSLNTTYHVVGTYAAATHTTKLYINSLLTPDTSESGYGVGASGAFNVGRRTDNQGYLPGAVDELAYYGYVLTQQQIVTHYLAGSARYIMNAGASQIQSGNMGPYTTGSF